METVYFVPPQKDTKIFFPLEVVGESHYQKNIKEAILFEDMVEKDDLEYKDETLIAFLILEDDNKFDPGNAVRVELDNKVVGYLAKGDAKNYREELDRLELHNVIGTCQAAVYMSREAEDQKMMFGVFLAIEPERHLTVGEPPKKKGCFAPAALIAMTLVLTLLLLS
jgi:hypothetical protein